jgi:hypothetical protein
VRSHAEPHFRPVGNCICPCDACGADDGEPFCRCLGCTCNQPLCPDPKCELPAGHLERGELHDAEGSPTRWTDPIPLNRGGTNG